MSETAASAVEAASLYRTVGIPVVEGLAAFHDGAYDLAVELLLPARFDLWQIGGSHAQRDVVDWTLTEAACAPISGMSPCRWRMNAWRHVRAAPQTGASSTVPRRSQADRAFRVPFRVTSLRVIRLEGKIPALAVLSAPNARRPQRAPGSVTLRPREQRKKRLEAST